MKKFPRHLSLEGNTGIRKKINKPNDVELVEYIQHAIDNDWIQIPVGKGGIYRGSGTVPDATLATLAGTLQFQHETLGRVVMGEAQFGGFIPDAWGFIRGNFEVTDPGYNQVILSFDGSGITGYDKQIFVEIAEPTDSRTTAGLQLGVDSVGGTFPLGSGAAGLVVEVLDGTAGTATNTIQGIVHEGSGTALVTVESSVETNGTGNSTLQLKSGVSNGAGNPVVQIIADATGSSGAGTFILQHVDGGGASNSILGSVTGINIGNSVTSSNYILPWTRAGVSGKTFLSDATTGVTWAFGAVGSLPAYDDDADAGSGGLSTGEYYQTTGSGAAPLNAAGIVMIKQ